MRLSSFSHTQFYKQKGLVPVIQMIICELQLKSAVKMSEKKVQNKINSNINTVALLEVIFMAHFAGSFIKS